jgi:hypothetical protein
MTVAHAAIDVARPVDEVFAVLTDPTRTPVWSSSAVEERWLTPPPHGIGSRRLAVTKGFGRRSENVAEVTAYEENRAWTMTSVSGPRFVASATFAPITGGTHIDFTWRFDLGRPLRVVEPIVMRAFMHSFKRDLGTLKALLESREL